jgi:hypothetical protein
MKRVLIFFAINGAFVAANAIGALVMYALIVAWRTFAPDDPLALLAIGILGIAAAFCFLWAVIALPPRWLARARARSRLAATTSPVGSRAGTET